MKVLNNITLDRKSIKELVYQGINYAFWYWAYTLPILYTKGYQEALEKVGISMAERKEYTQNMHELLGRMPFEELMKQSPRYAFKNTFGKNPFRDIILWANETGYEYDNYQNNIIKEYINTDGNLDIQKLNENYKLKLEKNYRDIFETLYKKHLEKDNICNLTKSSGLLNYFSKSYIVFENENHCIITNRIFDELQISAINEIMLINSYIYRDDYRIDNYQRKLTTSPEQYFATLNYQGEFNKANFTYACIDNFEKTRLYNDEIMAVSIISKNYVLESLSKIENEKQLRTLCDKTFVFMESVENRTHKRHYFRYYSNCPISVTYEEVINYRKEMNIETNN